MLQSSHQNLMIKTKNLNKKSIDIHNNIRTMNSTFCPIKILYWKVYKKLLMNYRKH